MTIEPGHDERESDIEAGAVGPHRQAAP